MSGILARGNNDKCKVVSLEFLQDPKFVGLRKNYKSNTCLI